MERKSLPHDSVNASAPVSSLFCLVYASSSIELFSAEQLVSLLELWRPKNAALGITGILLYKGGNLMQALEGEEEAVRGLYEKIRLDPRHRGVLKLTEHTISQRHFGGWSMGFRNLQDASLRGLSGYSEFLNVPLNDARFFERPSRVQRLLHTFKQTM